MIYNSAKNVTENDFFEQKNYSSNQEVTQGERVGASQDLKPAHIYTTNDYNIQLNQDLSNKAKH